MWFQSLFDRRSACFLLVQTLVTLQADAEVSRGSEQADSGRPLGRVAVGDLDEISGLAVSRQNPDVLWLHNDGDSRYVFAVNTAGGFVARVRLPVEVTDVEDMAIGPGPESGVDYLYLGDIGDNDEDRSEVRVIRLAEPVLSQINEREFQADGTDVFRLTYPDGHHNAEALLVEPRTGDIYIATKDERGARLYRAPAGSLQRNVRSALAFVATLRVEGVSGGDVSRAGDLIILRKEDRGWLWTRRPGESLAAALERPSSRVSVRTKGQGNNGEAVGFSPDGNRYYTVSEGKRATISEFPLPQAMTR